MMQRVLKVMAVVAVLAAAEARGEDLVDEVRSLAGSWQGVDTEGRAASLTVTPGAGGSARFTLVAQRAGGEATRLDAALLEEGGHAFLSETNGGGSFVLDRRSASLLRFARLVRLASEDEVVVRVEALALGAPRMDGSRKLTLTQGRRLCLDAAAGAYGACGVGELQTFMMVRQ